MLLTLFGGYQKILAIEAINTRQETPTLELIAYELQEMGFRLPTNCTYHSTMRKW